MHEPPSGVRFLVTGESARLARWLRLAGYDAAEMPAQPLVQFYRRAFNESRVVVTRNRRVRPSRLFRVVQLESQALGAQLAQVLREAGVTIDQDRAFSRCDRCNMAVEPIEKSVVRKRVPPYVFRTQERFHRCPSCRRIYWAATHWQRAQRFFDNLGSRQSWTDPSERSTQVGGQPPPEEGLLPPRVGCG